MYFSLGLNLRSQSNNIKYDSDHSNLSEKKNCLKQKSSIEEGHVKTKPLLKKSKDGDG